MRRRKLLIFAAVAAPLLTGYYIYWAWDPVDVTRYVPRDSIIILETEDLLNGLNNIRYREIVGLLPEPVRQEALLPYRQLGPGINAMHIIGTRCVIFVPACAANTIPRGTVLATRISQRSKLAEILASLVGKTRNTRSPAGRNVKMIQAEGLDAPIFYARVDRILIMSDSLDSLDAALGTPPPASPVILRNHPGATLKISKEGFTAILQLLSSFYERKHTPFIGGIIDQMGNIMGMEIAVSLTDGLKVDGHFSLYAGGVLESLYRADYRAYRPKGFDAIPGSILAAVSTNDADIAEELEIGTIGLNRVFHVTSDFFDDMKSFKGELTLASTRIEDETVEFLFVATEKILFSQDTVDALLDRLRTKIGATTYVGKEAGGDVYRTQSAQLDVTTYLWISQGTIVMCSSESAFRAFLAKSAADTGRGTTFEEGDFFLVANPSIDPNGFIKMLPAWNDRYSSLLNIIGPVRFYATSSGGKLKFSGSAAIRPERN